MISVLKSNLILSFIGLIVAALIYESAPARSSAATIESTQTTVEVRLQELGEKYDKFFTVEQIMREPATPAEIEFPLVFKFVTRSPDKASLEEELQELRRLVPQLTYWTDAQNPRLIHIMDTRLAGSADYAVEQTINSIEFQGKMIRFVSALNKQNNKIVKPGGCFTPCETGDGEVNINARDIKVRDALSHYVNLDNRIGRILWTAMFRPDAQKTVVEFLGAPGKAKQLLNPPRKTVE